MREVELTVQALEDLNTVIKKLEKQNYKLTVKKYMKDYYMIHKIIDLDNDNYGILQKCLLIRYLIIEDKYIKLLLYKNKKYDKDGRILSQSKLSTEIDSIERTKEILEAVGFTCLFEIESNMLVYEKDNTEITVQDCIYPKGIYIEIEANDEELLENNDERVKEILKEKLDSLELKTTGDYEVKKAIIALEKIKNR